MAEEIEVVLFDLGGVLVRLGGVASMRRLTGLDSDDELWRRWLTCPWVRRYERGLCTSQEFAAGLVADWGLAMEAEAFLELFRAWPAGLFPGAEDLVRAVRRRRPVGCLSNTNALHWELMGPGWGLAGAFDVEFLSHQLALVKPDRELFDHVVGVLEVRPERLLFLDDNTLNVDQARAAGWAAVRVSGTHEAREALIAHGVL